MTTSVDPAIAYSVASNFHDLSHLLNDPAGRKMGYNKDFEYQMVSFHRIPSPAWIRAPFLTLGQVKAALESIPFLWNNSRPRSSLLTQVCVSTTKPSFLNFRRNGMRKHNPGRIAKIPTARFFSDRPTRTTPSSSQESLLLPVRKARKKRHGPSA